MNRGYPKEWFLDSYDELAEYLCRFCWEVSRDAQQCKNSHLFCYYCVIKAQETNVQCCPSCTTGKFTPEHVHNNIFAQKIIDNLNVRCICLSSNRIGCGWNGPLKERHRREELCPKFFVGESQRVLSTTNNLTSEEMDMQDEETEMKDEETEMKDEEKDEDMEMNDEDQRVNEYKKLEQRLRKSSSDQELRPLSLLPSPLGCESTHADREPLRLKLKSTPCVSSLTRSDSCHTLEKKTDLESVSDREPGNHKSRKEWNYKSTGGSSRNSDAQENAEPRGNAEQWQMEIENGLPVEIRTPPFKGFSTSQSNSDSGFIGLVEKQAVVSNSSNLVLNKQLVDCGNSHAENLNTRHIALRSDNKIQSGTAISVDSDRTNLNSSKSGSSVEMNGCFSERAVGKRRDVNALVAPTKNSKNISDKKRKQDVIDLTGNDSDGSTAASTKRCRAVDRDPPGVSAKTPAVHPPPVPLTRAAAAAVTLVVKNKKNGDSYEGYELNNKHEGRGEMEYRNGDVYSGLWSAGVRSGHGKMLYMSGSTYNGGWHGNKRHGVGRCVFLNGDSFQGVWCKDKMTADGVMTRVERHNEPLVPVIYEPTLGSVVAAVAGDDVASLRGAGDGYVGARSGGKRHGKGTMSFTDGRVYSGMWHNDNMHGKGVMKYGASERFEGAWVRGMRQGQGKWVKLAANGTTIAEKYAGQWLCDMKHGRGEHSFADGVYNGLFEKDHRHGQGVMKCSDGEIYDGMWVADQREGHGTTKFANGDKLVGNFVNGCMSHGTLTLANGDIFEGHFVGGVLNGEGKMTENQSKAVFTGTFLNGKRHGRGKLLGPGRMSYIGEWRDGLRHGHGITTDVEGAVFEGKFREGVVQDGDGTLKFVDGRVLVGKFANGLCQGRGTMTYPKGGAIVSDVGTFADSVLLGHNKRTMSDGSVFEGEWLGGNRVRVHTVDGIYEGDLVGEWHTGQGRMEFANGDVYSGDWFKNRPHGVGLMVYDDGDQYEGQWCEDEMHGHGIMSYADGRKYTGEWVRDLCDGEGELVDASAVLIYGGGWERGFYCGHGSLNLPNGDWYKGFFKDGEFDGSGTYYKKGGETCVAQWEAGKAVEEVLVKSRNGGEYRGPWCPESGRFGKGMFAAGDKTVFDGTFVDNFLTSGEVRFPNGDVFSGSLFEKGTVFMGKLTDANGDTYKGRLLKGMVRDGQGVFKSQASGTKYDGEWVLDKMHGAGIFRAKNGEFYHGAWINDLKHGRGVEKLRDGTVYDGAWENGMRHGVGATTFSDGGTHSGVYWKDKRHGQGKQKWVNGDVYIGNFARDLFHGFGTFKSAEDGDEKRGHWFNDKFVKQ